MAQEKPLANNPGICPICADVLNVHAWRNHMKKYHDWLYAHGGNVLYPPESPN